jgi:hypothetical protein
MQYHIKLILTVRESILVFSKTILIVVCISSQIDFVLFSKPCLMSVKNLLFSPLL